MIARLRLWLWERRLAHARTLHRGLEREFCRDIAHAKLDVETCEVMVARARVEVVRERADRARTRRQKEFDTWIG